jgi:BASS family bile acid:Na+ symporter
MESNFLTAVFLPLALGIIMLGMGMTLTLGDFKRVVIFPKAVGIGLFMQIILLPIIAFGIAYLFPLTPELAVGIMILAVCPGGATSNLISHLCKADVALSITLTAITSLVTVLTIPILVNFSLDFFMGITQPKKLQILDSMVKIILITVVPTALGMVINQRFPHFTRKSLKAVNIGSAVLFVVVVLGAILAEKENIVAFFAQAGPAALALNLVTMFVGYSLARSFGTNERQSFTISLESGIQNGTLGIAIATSPLMLNNPEMAISPAIYGLLMFFTAGILIFISRRGRAAAA